MILDSSALVAVVLGEDTAASVLERLQAADQVSVGAPTLVETSVVLRARAGASGSTGLDRLLAAAEVDVLPFTAAHVPVALSAFDRFGKGRHPAALNLGDCLAYATAAVAGRPLLCLGDDFARTDLPLAPLPPS